MALDPGYSYTTGIVTGSTSPEIKSSVSAPLIQYSRTATITSTLTSLTPEQCQSIVFLISGSTANMYFSINSGSAIQPIPNHPLDVAVDNAAEIRVSGSSAVISYIVSK